MLVGVSTGVLYPHINGINRQINFFRKSGLLIDGLELSFDRSKKIMRATKSGVLKLTGKNEAYIKQLKFNTIHLPWLEVSYSEKESRCLSILSNLHRKLNSRVAVIHPDCVKSIETYTFLQKCFPTLSVENMTPDKCFGYSIENITKIISQNTKIGVVLDIAHSMESKETFEMYEKAFYSRLTEIHVSVSGKTIYKNYIGPRHMPLFKASFSPNITQKHIPLIIEGGISTIEELKKEVDIVRRL